MIKQVQIFLQDCLQKQRLQQKAATVARESEIHFRLWPEILVLDQMGKSLSLPERLRDTTFPLSPRTSPKSYSHLSQRPKLISKQIRFLICIWMRAWSAVIHYRAWLCGLRHKSGSQRCHPVQGLLCANWFFAPSICPHLIFPWNDTLHSPRKIEGKHRGYILHHELHPMNKNDQNEREQPKHGIPAMAGIRRGQEVLFRGDPGIWNL